MEAQKQDVSQLTFLLAKTIMSLRNAETYATVLSREKNVTGRSKETLKRIANRAKMAVAEFTDLLTPASLQVMKEELLPDEICLQLESINDLILALPKGTRDEIESYIQARYDIYRLNK